MRKSTTIALAALVASGLIAMQTVSYAQEAGEKTEKAEKAEKHERHPIISRAIVQVKRVKDELEHADKDFEGHRVAAIKHLDEALEELHKCEEVDKK